MRHSRIISSKSKAPIKIEVSFPFSAYILKLWLCEPLYLPALRATFLQRKAFRCVACGEFFMPAKPASELASDYKNGWAKIGWASS